MTGRQEEEEDELLLTSDRTMQGKINKANKQFFRAQKVYEELF